jgi:cytochrome P450
MLTAMRLYAMLGCELLYGCDASLSVQLQSETELRDVVMSFIIAGRDTTANALTWCFWELSKHAEINKRYVCTDKCTVYV